MKSMSVRSMKFNLGRKKPENKDVDALAAVPEQTPPFPPTQQRHHSTSDEDELSSVGEDSNSSTGARDDYKNNNKSDTSSTKLFQTKKKGSTTPALEAAYKFGIADRLTRTVEVKVAQSTVKRSPDLVPLTRQFDAFRKKIHKIIELTKKYHSSLTQVDENRLRMMADLSKLAEGSPLHQQVRSLDNESFYAVYMDVSEQVNIYATNFENQAVEYLIEWEHVATTRVDRSKAEVEQLRKTFLHYTQKVDKLRNQINKEETKGRVIKEEKLEKLKRNEDKLEEASEEFEAAAAPLCYLIEEIVVHAYKDLYPLIRLLMKWDADRSTVEQRIFGEFKTTHLEEAFQRAMLADAQQASANNPLTFPITTNNNDETIRSSSNNYDKSDSDIEDLEEPEVTAEPISESLLEDKLAKRVVMEVEKSPSKSSKDKAPSLLKRQSSIESGDDDDDDEVLFEPIVQSKKQNNHKPPRRSTRDHNKDRSGDYKHKHQGTKKEVIKPESKNEKKSSDKRVVVQNKTKASTDVIPAEDNDSHSSIDFGNANDDHDENHIQLSTKEETKRQNVVGPVDDDTENHESDEETDDDENGKAKEDSDNDGSCYDYVDDSDEQEESDSDDEPPPRCSRGYGV